MIWYVCEYLRVPADTCGYLYAAGDLWDAGTWPAETDHPWELIRTDPDQTFWKKKNLRVGSRSTRGLTRGVPYTAISIPGAYIPTCHVTRLLTTPEHLPSHQQPPPNPNEPPPKCHVTCCPSHQPPCHPQPHKHARKHGTATMSPCPSPLWGMWVVCPLSISSLTTPRRPRWCISPPSQSKCMNPHASSSACEHCPATGIPPSEHLPFPLLILPFPSIVHVLISIN